MGTVSILMVGVGGQGIVLASNVLCVAAMYAGYDVKKSEIHGMAQRGGSVVSHVRFGDRVYSPSIPLRQADYILSFERMEFLRYLSYKHDTSVLILNTRRILPPAVAMGEEEYPDGIIDRIKNEFRKSEEVDADMLATQAGSQKTAGVVLLGVMSKFLSIDPPAWDKAVRQCVPAKAQAVNIKAMELGRML